MTGNTGNIGFEETLWKAADKLRGRMTSTSIVKTLVEMIQSHKSRVYNSCFGDGVRMMIQAKKAQILINWDSTSKKIIILLDILYTGIDKDKKIWLTEEGIK